MFANVSINHCTYFPIFLLKYKEMSSDSSLLHNTLCVKKSALTVHPIRFTASNGMHSHLSLAPNEIEADTHTNT